MLKNAMVWATIAVTDLDRAVDFYRNTLGLDVTDPTMGQAMVMAGGDTGISLYQRGPSKAENTQATFKVGNLEAEMDDLKSKGVVFEEYNMPDMNIVTENGVASWDDGTKMAWFKDPDGNILSILEMK